MFTCKNKITTDEAICYLFRAVAKGYPLGGGCEPKFCRQDERGSLSCLKGGGIEVMRIIIIIINYFFKVGTYINSYRIKS